MEIACPEIKIVGYKHGNTRFPYRVLHRFNLSPESGLRGFIVWANDADTWADISVAGGSNITVQHASSYLILLVG